MSERKLASIRRIKELKPIIGADRIELAIVDGWQLVVVKEEFNPGDFCVYFEIDSFLPIDPRYEFLRKSSFKKMLDKEGFRLKTIRLKGQISQGLALPLELFPELVAAGAKYEDDVTEMLKVEKYEIPIAANLRGKVRGNFPGVVPKTDAERIQNLTKYFDWYKDMLFEVSIKLDGTSLTIYLNQDKFGVCSRNLDLIETEENTYWKMARQFKFEERMRKLGKNLAIQAEVVGAGIQDNNEKMIDIQPFVFNVFDIDQHRYLNTEERLALLKQLNEADSTSVIQHVPIIGVKPVLTEYPTMEALLAFADGPSLNPEVKREGLVFKGWTETGEMICFKTISNAYLLK